MYIREINAQHLVNKKTMKAVCVGTKEGKKWTGMPKAVMAERPGTVDARRKSS